MEITDQTTIHHYKFKRSLGKGNFGVVWEGYHTERNEQKVAIKIVDKELFNEHPKFESYLRAEMRYLPKIKHQNVVRFIDFFETEYALFFVIEYCNNGDLSQYLKSKIRIPEKEALDYLKQLISAFQVLNAHKIMHRDLKLENILLNKTETNEIIMKVCDFDFLKKGEIGNTYLGTCLYMAPEILKSNKAYTNKTDLWSLGVVFYKILYGGFPFNGKTEVNLIYNIESGKIKFPEEFRISQFSINLMKEIFQPEPEKRISWEKLYEIFNLEPIPPISLDEESNEKEHYKKNSLSRRGEIVEEKKEYEKDEKMEQRRCCLCVKKFF